MSTRVTISIIFGISLLFFLAFNANIDVTDPVEANYALTAKEMLQSGDWLSPRIYGEFWFDKPVMIYWLIECSYLLFGINEFAARFPAALFSAASVAWCYWFSMRLYGIRPIAMLSALALATSLEYWVLARMIITDAVLFFFTSVTLASFYLGLRNYGQRWFILAYASAGLAVLTKGPVGIVLPSMIILVYVLISRQWGLVRKFYLVRGLAVFLAVAAPWYWVMYKIHGMDFVNTFLGLHNYLRATVSEHPKDNVFYYYLVLFPVSLLPWSGVLVGGVFSRRLPRPIHFTYLMSWIGVILVFYSLMATKYLTYVFPASFPGAILIGYYLHQFRMLSGRKRWLWLSGPAILLFVLLGIGTKWLSGGNWLVLYIVIGGAITAIVWLQSRGKVRKMPEVVALSAAIVSLVVISSGLVPLAANRSAKDAAQAVPPNSQLAMYGDYSTAAVFYSGITAKWLVSQYVKDDGNVWSKKYNIPEERIDIFETRTRSVPGTYLLVRRDRKAEFEQSLLGKHFFQVGDYRKFFVYQRSQL